MLAYIKDPDGYAQGEAEAYIRDNQEDILIGFLENEATAAAYKKIAEDKSHSAHTIRRINQAMNAAPNAKTVNVTIRKIATKGEPAELTFKADADQFTGSNEDYSSYKIQAADRQEYYALFGSWYPGRDYTPNEILQISYGKKTIYSAEDDM